MTESPDTLHIILLGIFSHRDQTYGVANHKVKWQKNFGGGNFSTPQDVMAASPAQAPNAPTSVVAADLNSDGFLDLVLAEAKVSASFCH